MNIKIDYLIGHNTTATGAAIIPVQPYQYFTLQNPEYYVPLARYNEAVYHLETMVALVKQVQQRLDESDAENFAKKEQ